MSADPTPRRGTFQLLTSPGPAAIAVVRLRGALCEPFLRAHLRGRSKTAGDGWVVGRVLRAELLDEAAEPLDDVLVSVHAPPPTPDLRLHLHGSPAVVRCCCELLDAAGFAEESEDASTLWPSANLIEAEAYALLPRMLTLRGVEWLTRQIQVLSDALRTLAEAEDVESARERCREIIARRRVFDWFAQPLRVALAGPPNAGKSTLANALADRPASIVSATPGTTRDWVEIAGEIEGFPVQWLDTAGLATPAGELEAEAIRRTYQLLDTADAVLVVLDADPSAKKTNQAFLAEQRGLRPACVALNKIDLLTCEGDTLTTCATEALATRVAETLAALPQDWRNVAVPISAARRTGLDALGPRLLSGVDYDPDELAAPAAFSTRQVAALEAALGVGPARFRARLLDSLGPGPAR